MLHGRAFSIVLLLLRSLGITTYTFQSVDHSIIVNEINGYRNKLICSKGILNMEHISSDTNLVERAQYLMIHNRTSPHSLNPKKCKYKFNNSTEFEISMIQFIRKCIRIGNFSVDPNYTKIGCTYSLSNEKLWCALNEPGAAGLQVVTLQVDNSIKYIDSLKKIDTLFNNTRIDKLRSDLTSCYLTNSIRKNIITEMNEIREIVGGKNFYHPIDWDFGLEIMAIEASKYQLGSTCLAKDDLLNGIGVYEFGTNVIVQPHLDEIIPQLIRNATKSVNSTNELSWMYDTQFNAIGCTLFTVYGDGKFLCVFNKRKMCSNNDYPGLCSLPINDKKFPWNLGVSAYLAIGATIIVVSVLIVFVLVKNQRSREMPGVITRPISEPTYAEIIPKNKDALGR